MCIWMSFAAISTGSALCCELIAAEMRKTYAEFAASDTEDVLERACFAQQKVRLFLFRTWRKLLYVKVDI